MFKKIVFVCGMFCVLSANAQSSNFEGASIALNYNAASFSTNFDNDAYLGESSNNASIQSAYSFALSEKSLLTVGATYFMGDLKAGKFSPAVYVTAKDLYTVYIEPAYVIGTTAIFAKLAYLGAKGVLTDASDISENLIGTGYGLGVRTILDKNIYMQVEFMNAKFNSKTFYYFNSVVPTVTVGTVGIGYKF